jgi:hypothetical protein
MARLLTEQEFEQRFMPEDTFVQSEPRDIVQTLESAGFVPASQSNALDLVGTASSPAPSAVAPTATSAASAPAQTSAPLAANQFKELLKQAAQELTPNYFLTNPTGQAAAEGELPTYLPTQVGEDFQGSFFGEYGGLPVHRFSENELHINVPTPQGDMRYIFDKEGNFVDAVRVNPDTGIVTRVFPAAATAVLTAMGIPAPIAAGVTSYGITGDFEKALKAAGMSFVGQQFMPMIDKPINQLASAAANLLPSTAPDVLTNLVSDAVSGGGKALVGQGISSAITGQKFDPMAAFLGGAVSESTKNLLSSSPELKQLPPEIRNSIASAVMAGVLGKDPTAAAINTFINQTLRSAGKTLTASQTPSTGGPAAFETKSIIEPGDMGGTLVPGEAGEDYVDPNRVIVAGRNEPADLLSLLNIDTASTGLPTSVVKTTAPKADQSVQVTGNILKTGDDILDSVLNDVFVATGATQSVPVTGKTIGKESTVVGTAPGQTAATSADQKQTVPVIGTKESTSLGDQFLNDLIAETVKPEQVTVTGKKIPKDDITDQSVSVTSTKLPPDEKKPATTPTTTPAVKPPVTTPTVTPRQQVAMPQQDMSYITDLPLYRSVFYEKMQQAERQKELARALQEQENADPYERLMALAERNPGMAVDELMKIVEGT